MSADLPSLPATLDTGVLAVQVSMHSRHLCAREDVSGGAHCCKVAFSSSHMERRALVKVARVHRDARFDVAPKQGHVAVKHASAQVCGSLRGRQIQPVSINVCVNNCYIISCQELDCKYAKRHAKLSSHLLCLNLQGYSE